MGLIHGLLPEVQLFIQVTFLFSEEILEKYQTKYDEFQLIEIILMMELSSNTVNRFAADVTAVIHLLMVLKFMSVSKTFRSSCLKLLWNCLTLFFLINSDKSSFFCWCHEISFIIFESFYSKQREMLVQQFYFLMKDGFNPHSHWPLTFYQVLLWYCFKPRVQTELKLHAVMIRWIKSDPLH